MTPSINDIIETTRAYYGIDRAAFVGPFRGRRVARPRQVAMYLCRLLTNRSYPEIGRKMNNRDHTTILHGHRRITALIAARDAETIEAITAISEWLPAYCRDRAEQAERDRLCLSTMYAIGEACKAFHRFAVCTRIAPLTPHQRAIYEAIRMGHNTRARLRSHFGLSESATGEHVQNLIGAGAIERVNVGVYRAIEISDTMEAA